MDMAPNPIIALGLASGFIASIIIYFQSKNVKESAKAFILWFLALGTPFHFVLVGIYFGQWVNNKIFNRWSYNWGTFLLSLAGVFPLFAVWQGVMRLLVAFTVTGIDDTGGAIVLGIGVAYLLVLLMLMGIGVYILSTFYVSYKRRRTATLS